MGRRSFFGIRSISISRDSQAGKSSSKGQSKSKKSIASSEDHSKLRSSGKRKSSSSKKRGAFDVAAAERRNDFDTLTRQKMRDKAKQKSEMNRSLRKMKKRDVVKQMLQSFPKDSSNVKKNVTIAPQQNSESIPATIVDHGDEEESLVEADYASRKLLIRQMQGIIAKEVHGGEKSRKGEVLSEYDSWSDLEENFALAYEPIPLEIELATWRKMSKKDILDTVRSKKMRADFETMSRTEILVKIEKMQKSARYLSEKFGVDHLLPKFDHVVAEVHRSEQDTEDDDHGRTSDEDRVSNFSQNVPIYLSRSEILKNYSKEPHRPTQTNDIHNKVQVKRHHDSWSSRASSIMKNPESIYVSREEVLKNWHHTQRPAEKSKKKIGSGDSWSSHASSILAKSLPQIPGKNKTINAEEPKYVSRTELIEKIEEIAYDTNSSQKSQTASSAYSFSTGSETSDSNSVSGSSSVATVKNVVLKSRVQLNSLDGVQNGSHSKPSQGKLKSQASSSSKKSNSSASKTIAADDHHHNHIEHHEYASFSSFTSDCDSCSCTSCEAAMYSEECSCCNGDLSYSYSSSNCTVINGGSVDECSSMSLSSSNSGRDKRNKHNSEDDFTRKSKKVYIVNGKSSPKSVKPEKLKQSFENVSQISKVMQQNDAHWQKNSKQQSKSEEKENNLGANLNAIRTDNNPLFKPVSAKEIKRQNNANIMKKHLREMAADWDTKINDLNTIRRGHVLKELKRFLREQINLDNMQPDEINQQVEVLLREALDSNFEALSDKNVGQMYIPVQDQASHAKMKSLTGSSSNRENTTDYDTFGSIDSLIFEPKIGGGSKNSKYIKQAQDAIDKQFNYLNQEDAGEDSQDDSDSLSKKKELSKIKPNVAGPGKTTFAERVKLFQNLSSGTKTSVSNLKLDSDLKHRPPAKKITFLDMSGQETSWKQLANDKDSTKTFDLGEEAMSIKSKSRSFAELIDDSCRDISLCSECDKPVDTSTSVTCSSCCEHSSISTSDRKDDHEDNRRHSNAVISTSESWNFVTNGNEYSNGSNSCSYSDSTLSCSNSSMGKNDEDNESISCDSVNSNAISKGIIDMKPFESNQGKGDLRRQLKETFGAEINTLVKNDEGDGRKIESNNSFLEEYASRQSLSESSDETSDKAVLLRSGKAVALTEEMFRGELKGTLNKMKGKSVSQKGNFSTSVKGLTEEVNQSSKNMKQGSEMGDSGIASPPAAQSLLAMNASQLNSDDNPRHYRHGDEMHHHHRHTHLKQQEDSGLDENTPSNSGEVIKDSKGEKKVPLPGMKKRDTMIRELKSKLKEKFHLESTTSSSSESNSLNPSQKDSSVEIVPAGTVIQRRESMGPKLNKLFGSKNFGKSGLKGEQSSSLSASQTQKQPVAVLPHADGKHLPSALKIPQEQVRVSSRSSTNSASSVSSATTVSSREPRMTSFKNLNKTDATKISGTIKTNQSSSTGSVKVAEFYSESEGSVYDPSLPEELKKSVQAGVMFRGSRPFTPPPASANVTKTQSCTQVKNKNGNSDTISSTCSGCGGKKCMALEEQIERLANAASPEECREFLYGPGGIFGPKGPFSTPMVRYPHGLEMVTQNGNVPKQKSVAFEAAVAGGGGSSPRKTPNGISLSDSSSAVAEDRSVKSQYVMHPVISVQDEDLIKNKILSRMETYRKEWADQECIPSKPDSKPLVPEDLERWHEEKARRMLAWITNSQLTGYWGSEIPWWKVGTTRRQNEPFYLTPPNPHLNHVFDDDHQPQKSFFDSLNIVPANASDTTTHKSCQSVHGGGFRPRE